MTNALTALVMLFILSFSPFDAFALDFDAEIRKNEKVTVQLRESIKDKKTTAFKGQVSRKDQKGFRVVLLPKRNKSVYNK